MGDIQNLGEIKGVLVQGRNQTDYINHIRNGLDRVNLLKFKNSCFGHFLEISNLQFQGELLHLLYTHIDPLSLKKRRLTFLINNRRIEFGPREFHSLTGLRFGWWEEPPLVSSIHEKIFDGKQFITWNDVFDAFLQRSESHRGKGDIVFKLALLVVLYGSLLVRDRRGQGIELQYLHLVDNLELFDRFPWGLVAYEFLVVVSHNCRFEIAEKISQGLKPTVDAYGFTYPLQVFAYEVHPKLAAQCAVRPTSLENKFPRMLRWWAKNSISLSELEANFSSSCSNTLKRMRNTAYELDSIERSGITESLLNPVDVSTMLQSVKSLESKISIGRKLFGEDVSYAKRQCHSSKTEMESNFEMKSTKEFVPHSSINSTVAKDMLNVSRANFRILTNIESILLRCEKHLFGNKMEENACDGNFNMKEHTLSEELGNTHMSLDLNNVVDLVTEVNKPNATPKQLNFHMCLESYSDAEISLIFKKSLPKYRILLEMQTRLSSEGSNAADALCYPLEIASEACLGNFETWYRTNRIAKRDTPIEGVLFVYSALPSWFDAILSPKGKFIDDQLDALVNLVLLKFKEMPQLFKSDWTVVEHIGWQALCSDNIDLVKERIVPYICGNWPREAGKAWHLVEKVVGLAHVKGGHWVCYELNFDKQQIIVYDSLSKSGTENVELSFGNVLGNLAWLCSLECVWENRWLTVAPHATWELVIYETTPQQDNGCDCGVMAFQFLHCIVSGNSVERVKREFNDALRLSFCADLFDVASKFGKG